MKIRNLKKTFLAFSMLVAVGQSFAAGTANGTLTVTGTVLPTCSVTSGNLSFGTTIPTTISSPITTSTNVSVTCSSGTPYSVMMGLGTASGATKTARKMLSGSNVMTYGLYTDSAYANAWSDTVAATPDNTTVQGNGNGSGQIVSIFGKIPAQTVVAGNYSDSVVITVSY